MPRPSAHVFLIDGSSYIYRAFFALPPLTSPSGAPTNAAFGFASMTLKLLREVKPQYLAVVFDAPGGTFRDTLFEAYKANRPRMPDDLVAQLPLVREVVAALGVRSLTIAGVEADDVIATLTERFARAGTDCVVITADKDLMQLVGPHVRLWDTMRDRWTDEAGVRERFGVLPKQVVDVMALMGDSIDNIPGVKGIGEKTAMALIQEFGSLDSVLESADEVERSALRNAKRVAALLREGAAAARLSRDLARVRRDVPLALALDELAYKGPDAPTVRALFQRLGFQSLLRDIPQPATTESVAVRTLATAAEVAGVYAQGTQAGRVGLAALGAVPPDAWPPAQRAEALILQVDNDGPFRVALTQADLISATTQLLADPAIEKIGHDLKRDLLRFDPAMVLGGRCFDTMVASYLVDAGGTHRLEDLASDLLGRAVTEFRASAEGVAAGVALLPRLASELSTRLEALGMTALFRDIEMPLVQVLTAIERRGVRLDVAALATMSREYEQRLSALAADIYALAGGEFNLNSPPQLRTVLFERLGLSTKGVRRGKTGYSTDVDVLTRLAEAHPVPAKIIEYRGLAKLKSTYIDALPAAVNPATGRLHASLNQTVAVTGRLSSSDPNLQNIPIRGEEGQRIRAAFIADPGNLLLAADYSQIELRVLAHLAGDAALIDAFRAGADIHARTAAEMFGVLPGLVSADMRRAAKVINFGIIYGMGAPRVANELGIPVAEAQRYIDRYFTRYAGVRRFLDETIAKARASGYVTTLYGRRRALPDLASRDRVVAQAAERTATNTPIQGSAADIIKMAMVVVDRRLREHGLHAAMILQVHDELVFEVAAADLEPTRELVRTEMEGVVQLAVPLRVEISSGPDWAKAHG
ncbi:MAG: DNA polymerase I [Deltaproteobacteria bacterium]|nr:DNA polymerase I [Deltaproteobacteria bacterium]